MPNHPESKLKFIPDTVHNLLSGNYGVRAEKEVGHGYAGTVLKCAMFNTSTRKVKVKGTELVAAKVMPKTKIKAKIAENEAKLLRSAKGPNLLQYMTAVECIDSYVIVTEFCGRGDLHGTLGKLDNCFVMAREYLLGVALGLEVLHNKFIAHCDIKMKNILISDNNVAKIADFGFAMRFSSATDTTTICHGTKDYWAPEMWRSHPVFNPFKADIYALGVTFVGVCEKKPIKKNYDNIHAIIREYKNPHQREFFQGVLKVKPEERFTLAQIQTHRWICACTTPPPTP